VGAKSVWLQERSIAAGKKKEVKPGGGFHQAEKSTATSFHLTRKEEEKGTSAVRGLRKEGFRGEP